MYNVILKNLDCANCAAKIENAINKIEGIDEVSVNFMTNKMIFSCSEDKLDLIEKEIINIIKRIEPDVEVVF